MTPPHHLEALLDAAAAETAALLEHLDAATDTETAALLDAVTTHHPQPKRSTQP